MLPVYVYVSPVIDICLSPYACWLGWHRLMDGCVDGWIEGGMSLFGTLCLPFLTAPLTQISAYHLLTGHKEVVCPMATLSVPSIQTVWYIISFKKTYQSQQSIDHPSNETFGPRRRDARSLNGKIIKRVKLGSSICMLLFITEQRVLVMRCTHTHPHMHTQSKDQVKFENQNSSGATR